MHIVRDLKPENLLLTAKGKAGVLKIGDFGLSKIVKEDELMKTACGTWAYCGKLGWFYWCRKSYLCLAPKRLRFSNSGKQEQVMCDSRYLSCSM